eukprot:s1630_g7.t4
MSCQALPSRSCARNVTSRPLNSRCLVQWLAFLWADGRPLALPAAAVRFGRSFETMANSSGDATGDAYYNGAQNMGPGSAIRSDRQLLREQLTPDARGLIVAMVGLPARGKSFISRKLERFLKWSGSTTKTFNVGKYRRDAVMPERSGRSEFFDNQNPDSVAAREKMAMTALADAIKFLDEGGKFAIFDATNSTVARRQSIAGQVRAHGHYSLIWVEAVCDDEEVVRFNMLTKVKYSPDFKEMSADQAMSDLTARIQKYSEIYETIQDSEGAFIKLFNLSSKPLLFLLFLSYFRWLGCTCAFRHSFVTCRTELLRTIRPFPRLSQLTGLTTLSWVFLSDVSPATASDELSSVPEVPNMWSMACLLGIAAGVVLGLRSFGKRGKSSQLPSGPSPVELFSHLSRSAFVQEKWVQKHGEIFQTWLPFLNIVSIADPDATRDIAVSKGNNYRDPCLFGRDRRLAANIEEALGPGSSFPTFEEWRWRKQSLSGELSFAKLLRPEKGFLQYLLKLGKDMCRSLDRAETALQPIRINDLFSKAAAAAVLYLLFGREVDFDSKALEKSHIRQEIMEVLEEMLLPQMPAVRQETLAKRGRAHAVIDAVLGPELEDLVAEIDAGTWAENRHRSLLQALLIKEPRWRGRGLPTLLAEIRNFVNAGYEIQAFALSFTEDILRIGFKPETLLQSTNSMQAVFNEALRLLPPTPSLSGTAYDDFNIDVGGRTYGIAKGSVLNFQVLAGQRSTKFGINQAKLMTYNYGAHSCPGRDVSSLEARVWLPMLLARYRFELARGVEQEVDSSGVHLRPKDGLKVMANHCYGRVAKSILPYLMAIHIGSRPIWLARAGPGSTKGQNGSDRDSTLSDEGQRYAKHLAAFVQQRSRRYWDSSGNPKEHGLLLACLQAADRLQ